MIRQSVGDPKELVTPSCWIAWTIFAGSTVAGCGAFHPNAHFHGLECPAKNLAHHWRERDAEEDPRFRASNASEEVFPAHARVDDDRHGAELEQREHGGDQRQALTNHDQDAIS